MSLEANQTTETIDLCDSDEGEASSQEVITLDDSCSFINDRASRMSLRDNKKVSSTKKYSPFKFNENSDDKDIEIVAVQLGSKKAKTPRMKNPILRRRSGGSNGRLFGGGSGNILKPKLQGIQKKGKSPKKKKKKRGRQSDPFFIKQGTPQKTAQHKVNQARKILQNRQQKQETVVQTVDRNLRRHKSDNVVSISRNRKGKPNPFFQKGVPKFRFVPADSVSSGSVSSDVSDYFPWRIDTTPTPTSTTSAFPDDDDGSKVLRRPPLRPLAAPLPTVYDSDDMQAAEVDSETTPTSTTSSLLPTATSASRIVTREDTGEGDSYSFKITTVINNNNTSDHTTATKPTKNSQQPVSSISQPQSSKQLQQQQNPAPDTQLSIYGSNSYNSKPTEAKIPGSLRPIVIDGSNVAWGHGNHQIFSCRGIQICCEFFTARGHSVYAFVPRYRLKHSQSKDPKILDQLERQGVCKFTASREVNGQRIASYDDRYIVQVAADMEGIIVSNDNFKDLYKEQPLWRETIRNRVLQYTWVSEDYLMFPPDPLGAHGPTLDQFLRF